MYGQGLPCCNYRPVASTSGQGNGCGQIQWVWLVKSGRLPTEICTGVKCQMMVKPRPPSSTLFAQLPHPVMVHLPNVASGLKLKHSFHRLIPG